MGNRVADPKALGFGAFAIAGWMFGMLDSGWYAFVDAGASLHEVMVFSALALLIAALASFLRDEAWYAVFFMFWSALTWGFRAGITEVGMTGVTAYAGWGYMTVALVSLLLFLAALKAAGGLPVVLVALGVTVAMALLGLGGWLGGGFWAALGGYAEMATGLAAFWATAAALLGTGGARAGAAAPQ